jgi:hypothetical protein
MIMTLLHLGGPAISAPRMVRRCIGAELQRGLRLLTVGVDLAAEPANTAVVRMRWVAGGAEVEALAAAPMTRCRPPSDNEPILFDVS